MPGTPPIFSYIMDFPIIIPDYFELTLKPLREVFPVNMTEIEQINQILSRALKMEKFGQNFFSLLEGTVDDEESRKLFHQLAAEEEKHCRMFLEELRLNGGEVVDNYEFEPDRIFNKGVASIIKEGPVAVLGYAIEVKQRIIAFYTKSLGTIQNSGIRKFLKDLITYEENHKKLLSMNMTMALIAEA